MSNMDNFDKYVKDALGNYSPVLPDGAWEKLWAERERRKPKAAWYFNKRNIAIVAAVLLCSTAVIFFTQNKSSNENINTQNNSNAVTDKNNSTASADKTSSQNITEADKANTNTLKQNTAGDAGANDAALKSNTAIEKQTANPDSYRDKKQNNIAAAITNNDAVTNDNINRKQKNKFYSSRKSYSIKQSSALTDEEGEITDDNVLSAKESFHNRLYFESDKITALSFKNLSSVKPDAKYFSSVPCPQIEMDAAGNKSYWEFYAGPDYASKGFRDTANSVYLQKVKASTKFSSAFSAGIRYTKVFGTGVSIRAGINFSQVNEKFSFLQSNIVQVNYIIDPVTGDTTGSYTVRGTRYKTTHNHYRTIDVPLLIGYEMGNGKFHANINAGAMVNLYSWQKGETLDTAFQPVSITTGKGDKQYQYKTNIGFGFTAGASLYYKLNETLHVLAEPYIRYNITPMSRDKLSLQERFTTIGLRLGFRFDIQ